MTDESVALMERLEAWAAKERHNARHVRGPAFHPPWGQDIIDRHNQNADDLTLCLALLADNARMREMLEEREAARSQPGAACPSDCAENEPLRADGWLHIATAPRDGTPFTSQDRTNYGYHEFAGTRWYTHPSVSGWITDDLDCGGNEFEPTHWMPPPPSDHVGGEG